MRTDHVREHAFILEIRNSIYICTCMLMMVKKTILTNCDLGTRRYMFEEPCERMLPLFVRLGTIISELVTISCAPLEIVEEKNN